MAPEGATVAAEQARLVADLRGSTVAVIEPGQVMILNAPSLEAAAELGIAGDLDDHDIEFVGETGRLAVLSRISGSSTLHVVDPAGPTKLGEVRFRVPARIACTAGEYVLVTAGTSTFVVDVTAAEPVALPLPVRGEVTAAGRIGPHRFVLTVSGVIEEWDALTRAPGRRLRLDRPLDPLFVGGNALRIWMVPRGEPEHIDLVMLTSRSTRRIELPEPVASIDAHDNGDTLALIGARTRSAYVVDLTRASSVVKIERGAMTDIAWLGRGHTLVLKPAGGALELVKVAVAVAPPPGDEVSPGESPPLRGRGVPPSDESEDAPPRVVEDERPPARWTREDIDERLAAWRDRYATDGAKPAPVEVATAPRQVERAPHDARRMHPGGWRAELATWARAIKAGSHRDPPAIGRGILDDTVERLRLSGTVGHAIALLYGAYLGGAAIVTPIDLASALGWDWKEALGSGAVADSGLVRWRDGRIALHREAIAVLDERPPIFGAIVQAAASTESAVAIVVPAAIDPARIGAWAAPTVGALLVPNERAHTNPRGFVREARIRGVTPLVRWTELAAVLRVPPHPAAIVVEHATTAASLELPVVATWSGTTAELA